MQIPAKVLRVFNEHELELLISGLPTIDGACVCCWCASTLGVHSNLTVPRHWRFPLPFAVDDLRRNTTYNNYRESDEVIQWFWKAIESFTEEERARFIQFVTGACVRRSCWARARASTVLPSLSVPATVTV